MKVLLISSKDIEPNVQEIDTDDIRSINLISRQVELTNRLIILDVAKIKFPLIE